MRLVHWVSISKDKKIGEVLASYSPKETCPDSCSLKEGGCYAWGLFYLRALGKKIAEGKLSKTLKEAANRRAYSCKIARHRVAGDVVGDQKETLEECKEIERLGLINIGYTHDWRSEETQIMKEYFRASCQNVDEVLEARSNGWGATLIVPKDTPNKVTLSNGEIAIMCPVVRREKAVSKKVDAMTFSSKKEKRQALSLMKSEIKINCNSCTLCKINENTINKTVMFEVHGAASTLNSANGKVAVISK